LQVCQMNAKSPNLGRLLFKMLKGSIWLPAPNDQIFWSRRSTVA
jgi:hypothetical protein